MPLKKPTVPTEEIKHEFLFGGSTFQGTGFLFEYPVADNTETFYRVELTHSDGLTEHIFFGSDEKSASNFSKSLQKAHLVVPHYNTLKTEKNEIVPEENVIGRKTIRNVALVTHTADEKITASAHYNKYVLHIETMKGQYKGALIRDEYESLELLKKAYNTYIDSYFI
jgi:hypothetical protein